MSEITPVTLELAASELSFPSHVDPPRRYHGFAQGLPEIQKIDPAAISEIPLRPRETIHFCLCIEARVPRAEDPLFDRKAIVPKRELRRETHRQRFVPLRGALHVRPFK